ncbi:MAG: hypothetical protein M0Q44_01060 [Methylobacter sp.]|jgi:DamX protein|nr:hypothetical protein [Methylobacter sp.]
MVEDDTFTYHVKQPPRRDQANMAVQSLITKERMQKLDLLIHLLSNLTQALVVCGPEGIGKTTLLNVLQERKTESWRYCLMQGNADLSFEAIYDQLSTAMRRQGGQYKQVVLIVDNAGELVPGLISAIIQYAAGNPVLRVIFALTHDELQVKRGSDRAVDDCHIVEIPPLSERQCGDFLQDLSTKPSLNVSFKAIGENMIAHIYRETHGVPGRIIAELSGLSDGKGSGKLKWILVLAVAAAIVIAFGVQWLATSKKDGKKTVASVQQKADNIDIAPPRPESQMMPPLLTAKDGGSAAIGTTAPMQEAGQRMEPLSKEPAQPAIRQEEQVVPANAKDAVDVNTREQIAAAPEALIKQPEKPSDGAQQKIIESLLDKQGKPNQSGFSNTAPSVPERPAIKAQSEPVNAVDRKPSNKSTDAASFEAKQEKLKQAELRKLAESVKPFVPNNLETIQVPPEPVRAVVQAPINKQEKSKQAELRKPVDSVKPFAPNNLETIQIPQKPGDVVAVPGAQVVETLVPRQVEPEELLAQSTNNFTLQLMVLSKQSSVDEILKKYPGMGSGLRAIKTVANGQQRFVLEYGSYPDTVSANKARQTLPPEFRKALVRKIRR